MWYYTFTRFNVHKHWQRLISYTNKADERHVPQLPTIAPRRWQAPDSSSLTLKLDQTNLEKVFRGLSKWLCWERGAITLRGNHLIMEIISCHGYQSSFYVIGWIYASSGILGWFVQSVGEGVAGVVGVQNLFCFGVVMQHRLASVLSDCDYWQTRCFLFTVYTQSNNMIHVLHET